MLPIYRASERKILPKFEYGIFFLEYNAAACSEMAKRSNRLPVFAHFKARLLKE